MGGRDEGKAIVEAARYEMENKHAQSVIWSAGTSRIKIGGKKESDVPAHSSWYNQLLPVVSSQKLCSLERGDGERRGWTARFLLHVVSAQVAGGVITLFWGLFLSVARPPAAVFVAAEPQGWTET